MLTIMMMALAVNGGIYLGTILYSAYKSDEIGKAVDVLVNFRPFVIR
jgi:hypothetical protein